VVFFLGTCLEKKNSESGEHQYAYVHLLATSSQVEPEHTLVPSSSLVRSFNPGNVKLDSRPWFCLGWDIYHGCL